MDRSACVKTVFYFTRGLCNDPKAINLSIKVKDRPLRTISFFQQVAVTSRRNGKSSLLRTRDVRSTRSDYFASRDASGDRHSCVYIAWPWPTVGRCRRVLLTQLLTVCGAVNQTDIHPHRQLLMLMML